MSNIILKKRKHQNKNTKSFQISHTNKVSYTIETKKIKKDILFQVFQQAGKKLKELVKSFDFEKDAEEFIDFHNKNQVWRVNGGIPKYLLD
jgi:hypothetical protein|tara:strand:- start:50 stop:322 length:273 start_codon:yes stop_codon:yes gene_type:complete